MSARPLSHEAEGEERAHSEEWAASPLPGLCGPILEVVRRILANVLFFA